MLRRSLQYGLRASPSAICRASRPQWRCFMEFASRSMPSVSQPIESKGDAVRVDFIPASPSYFTGNATFTDDLLALEEMARKTSALPRVPANDSPKRSWITLEHYRVMSNNPLARVSQLRKIINILSDLNRIDPVFQTEDVKLAMERYTRQVQQLNPESERRERVLDAYGRAYETGGRKSSKAQVWLVKAGEQGEEPVQDATGSSIIVNGVSLAEYFGRLQDRSSVMWPLVVTERMEHYRAWVRVKGGGNTGQADAVKLGIARALLVFEPDLKPLLRKAGCVTRDSRSVERKKTGQPKARKKFAWVKR